MQNRTIKFRIWDDSLQEIDYEPLADHNDLNSGIKFDQETGIVYMQFTGLKDKNGKGIFEGDIVKVYLPDGEEYSLGCLFKVYYSERWGAFCLGGANTLGWYLNLYYDFEIIGNIYEDRDFLT